MTRPRWSHSSTTSRATAADLDLFEEGSTDDLGRHVYYYFGFGPVCNPLVRKRRGIRLAEDPRPAYINDHRLTFSFGAVADVIRQTGFQVHGLLMKFDSREDWEKVNPEIQRQVNKIDSKMDDISMTVQSNKEVEVRVEDDDNIGEDKMHEHQHPKQRATAHDK